MSGNKNIETQNFRIFVGGLTPTTTNQMLMSYFSKFGNITSAEVVYDASESTYYKNKLN